MQSTIQEYVLSFLKNNNAEKTLVVQWNSKENKEKLKELVRIDKTTKKVKPEKDPNKPSKNKTAYMFFCQENRATVLDSGKKGPEVFTELGKRWKECDPQKKTEYEKKATEDKKRYADDIEEYKTKTKAS